jgi:hypothetical protein
MPTRSLIPALVVPKVADQVLNGSLVNVASALPLLDPLTIKNAAPPVQMLVT